MKKVLTVYTIIEHCLPIPVYTLHRELKEPFWDTHITQKYLLSPQGLFLNGKYLNGSGFIVYNYPIF